MENLFKFKPTKEKLEIIKAIASTDKETSYQAQEALAKIIAQVIQNVLPKMASSALIYKDFSYDPDSNPTLPLELFEGDAINTVRVWTQMTGGGAPTSEIKPVGEYKFTSYELSSAVSAKKKVVKDGNMGHVTKMIERMAQEILRGQELNAWGVFFAALAQATSGGSPLMLSATTANVLQLDDFNRLKTKVDRLHTAWDGGTPATTYGRKGMTDMFLSPEMMEQIRGFAYQPMNTRIGATGTEGTEAGSSTAVPLPDSVRSEIFKAAGAPSIYGVALHQLLELGVGKAFNTLFDTFYSGSPSFDGSTQEIVFGVDNSTDAFIRPVATEYQADIDVGSTVKTLVDDQFIARDEKFGYYTKVEEARVVVDNKSFYGLIV